MERWGVKGDEVRETLRGSGRASQATANPKRNGDATEDLSRSCTACLELQEDTLAAVHAAGSGGRLGPRTGWGPVPQLRGETWTRAAGVEERRHLRSTLRGWGGTGNPREHMGSSGEHGPEGYKSQTRKVQADSGSTPNS